MNSDTAEEKSKSNEPPTAGALGLVNVLYKDPNAAATAVKESYDYWTGKLTESSFALSLAVIGANWAVFGSVDRVLNNIWSELSICNGSRKFGNWAGRCLEVRRHASPACYLCRSGSREVESRIRGELWQRDSMAIHIDD